MLGQLAQGVVLLVGIIKIKLLISKSGYARMVNNFAFAMHFTIFSIYMIMLILLFCKALKFFLVLKYNNSDEFQIGILSFFEVWIMTLFTNFMFQIVLFWVLWRMNKHSNRPITTKTKT
jgi:hypothetical protein